MTEENYNYRTSGLFLRNQFEGAGKFNIPIIPKDNFSDADLDDLLLIGFDRAISDDDHFDRMVHFFLYDYKFEKLWQKPDSFVDKLKNYKAVLSPDFSMYIEMNRTLQLYNTFRNRWSGAYLANKGIRVIPTVNWGNEDTFDFCFEGIPKGSIVAVSTYMVQEHNHHADQKDFFMKGYNEMLRRIAPRKIICYSEPFEEMRGDIIYVDYELSGWKYLNEEKKGLPKHTENVRIVHKICVQPPGFFCKGSGSAYGGKWIPKKEEDKRLLGEPGEIKETFTKNGEKRWTKIGEEGRATKERHFSDHNRPLIHTNPHDHIIDWDENSGRPIFGKYINYPDGAPEFKSYERIVNMCNNNDGLYDEYSFSTISEFKWCIRCGGEIEFIWKGKSYSITYDKDGRINIGEGYYIKDGKYYNVESHEEITDIYGFTADTADEILEYCIDGEKLRSIITKVMVVARTI